MINGIVTTGQWCKTFLGGNLNFNRIKTLKKFALMTEPSQKAEQCYFK